MKMLRCDEILMEIYGILQKKKRNQLKADCKY